MSVNAAREVRQQLLDPVDRQPARSSLEVGVAAGRAPRLHAHLRCSSAQMSATSWRVYSRVSQAPGNQFSVMTATVKPQAVKTAQL